MNPLFQQPLAGTINYLLTAVPSLWPGSSLNLPTGQILNAQPPSKGKPAPLWQGETYSTILIYNHFLKLILKILIPE